MGLRAAELALQVAVLCAVGPAAAYAHHGFRGISIHSTSTYYVATNGDDAGPGTAARPWATINHAAEEAKPGETVIVRGGHYLLKEQVRPRNSGRADDPINFVGDPAQQVTLDAEQIPRSALFKNGLDNGALQIEGVSYVRIVNLTVINSHDAGITVRDSSHIDLINNSTDGTFSSGIAVWNSAHDDRATRYIRVLGNTIKHATTWDLAAPDLPRRGEPPHEALSIGGAVDFEVANNRIYDSDKEGIDIKETSKRGRVDHNLVDHVARQGIYVDAWFGTIDDIKIDSNVVRDCRGAGIAMSVENGKAVENVEIYNNLIFANDGSGLYFSRWGADGERRNIKVSRNTFHHNGYGAPMAGQKYFWMTGGLYLYSTELRDVSITDNVFSDNRGFQIGYSALYLEQSHSWREARREKNIKIAGNLINGSNAIGPGIEGGGAPADRVRIFSVDGKRPAFGDPLSRNASDQDSERFSTLRGVGANISTGADEAASHARSWWKEGRPPRLFRIQINPR